MKIAPALTGTAAGVGISYAVFASPAMLLLLIVVVAAAVLGLAHLYLRLQRSHQDALLKLIKTLQRR